MRWTLIIERSLIATARGRIYHAFAHRTELYLDAFEEFGHLEHRLILLDDMSLKLRNLFLKLL